MKYMNVSIAGVMFADSLSLMPGSLARLSRNHISAGKPLKYTRHVTAEFPDEAHSLLLSGKQSLCYDYLSSVDRLEEKRLPPIDCFYNKLKEEALPQEDYNQAVRLFDLCKCKNIRDYMMIYLRVDTSLLADTFCAWRDILYNLYQLDISFYWSLSGYAYDCFLKSTKAELDMVYDPELYHLLRCNLRGGFTTVVNQITRVDNTHVTPNFDPATQTSKYLLYLDFNSLYALCMTDYLPKGDIRKLNPRETEDFLNIGWLNHSCDSSKGYWAHIDTKPINGRTAVQTDELPLALGHLFITNDMISPYGREVLRREGKNTPTGKNKKLVATHLAQKDYLISLKLLQLLIKLGMEVERVHGIYEFTQERYLKPFIDVNISERHRTDCKITASAFKLLNNAIFGRSLMDITRYGVTHKYINSIEKFRKYVKHPLLKSVTPLGNDRVICTRKQSVLKMQQPSYLGFHILNTAKYYLYDWYYNTLKASYGERAHLIYSDTDSYIFSLECTDIENELTRGALSASMDFSNYPSDHHLFDESVRGKLGLLKSETGDRYIKEVVALKPKSYSLLMDDEQVQNMRCKGLPYHHHHKLRHDKFRATLHTAQNDLFVCRSICNYRGQIITRKITKTGLSAFDDKRYHLNETKSFAYGHPEITQSNEHVMRGEPEERVRVVTATREEEEEEEEDQEEEQEQEEEEEEGGEDHQKIDEETALWSNRLQESNLYFKH